jgi:hypothetical protein
MKNLRNIALLLVTFTAFAVQGGTASASPSNDLAVDKFAYENEDDLTFKAVWVVENNGASSSASQPLVDIVQDGYKVIRASNGGVYDQKKNTVEWDLPAIQPGEQIKLTAVIGRSTATTDEAVASETDNTLKYVAAAFGLALLTGLIYRRSFTS